jgi:hypothetical protein
MTAAVPETLALELRRILLAAQAEHRLPAELESAVGRWWSEGSEFVFSWRDGRLEARPAPVPAGPRAQPSVFEQLGGDRYRTVEGRERGELLRLVRDADGTVVKRYWATYPFERRPKVFGDRGDRGALPR